MATLFRPTHNRMKCLFCCVFLTLCFGFYLSLYLTCLSESRTFTFTRQPTNSWTSTELTLTQLQKETTNKPREYYDTGAIGPGANGKGVRKEIILSYQSRSLLDRHKNFHGFDTFISDVVDLKRKIPDLRSDACKNIVYPDDLPQTSVVIIFRDEWLSVLLRTVYSVLGNSPPELLKEIVLVDDGSTNAELITKVDLHIANLDNVKLLRNRIPLGLMVARDRGINATLSDYFIVMDSHMEVGPGWLEPVVNRLVETPKVVLCSKIGSIHGETFEYRNHGPDIGVFPFFDPLTLDQVWVEFSSEFKSRYPSDSVEPVPYGMVQGMMVAMTKGFYNTIGGFDTGMKVWGSEQLELSIKAWMCGGRVEMVPCSKMAHLFRQTPWTRNSEAAVYMNVNKGRLVNVWMDRPYTDHLAEGVKTHLHKTGNLSDRHEIRRINQCKPYSHFVDMVQSFSDVYFPKHPIRWGSVINHHYNTCLDLYPTFNEKKEEIKTVRNVTMAKCSAHAQYQYFLFTEYNELRSIHCKTVQYVRDTAVKDKATSLSRLEAVELTSTSKDPSTKWRLKDVSIGFKIVHNSTNLCLTASSPTRVILRSCIREPRQVWVWK